MGLLVFYSGTLTRGINFGRFFFLTAGPQNVVLIIARDFDTMTPTSGINFGGFLIALTQHVAGDGGTGGTKQNLHTCLKGSIKTKVSHLSKGEH